MSDEERDEGAERPLSPHYWQLKKLLDDAGVELFPTDRDLAPYAHSDDSDDSDEAEGQRGTD